MQAYIYARRRRNRKDRRLAIESRKGGNIMRGLMFADVPLEVWTRLLSVVCFGNYF